MSLFRWISCAFLLSIALSLPTQAQKAVAIKVLVSSVVGPPDLLGKQIREMLVEALAKQQIAVVAAGEGADFNLRFYVLAAKATNGAKVAYILDITDSSGKRVNRFTGEEIAVVDVAKDAWTAVSPALAEAIATKATTSFVDWMQAGRAASPGPPPPPASQVAAGIFTALVPPVAGAPGDGQSSLTAAIRRALPTHGITVVDQPLPKAHRVEGTVRLATARAGKQAISIEWVVKNPQGARIGTVSQKREIDAGSLDGAWGNHAEWAADAAAPCILKVLERKRPVSTADATGSHCAFRRL
jgi:hypothetical protein